ncbi:C40 family peptidase [Capnocytophaga sp. Marseille-Q4570]|uniref:C40 family peptidase n=1 Tax=Capnocytophaga bilenii TaxID=2819369 RepID=A0ABS3PYD9_9FLAO|nr:C40 family peptidase [Capnocytophaga bilenii]MBO1884290.1 C40 family peptidase [Capnocytophaga bilenii]
MYISKLLGSLLLVFCLLSFSNCASQSKTKKTTTTTAIKGKSNNKKKVATTAQKKKKNTAKAIVAKTPKKRATTSSKRKVATSSKRKRNTKKRVQYADNRAPAASEIESDEDLVEEEVLAENAVDMDVQKLLLDTAFSYLGTPYKHAGVTRKGMDCSGFVSTTFKAIDVPLSRSSQEMATQGKRIKLKNVRVGDLLFFKTLRHNRISHVGMVVDVQDGEVKFVHASSKRGVVISSLSENYYKKAFRMAKRVM